MSWRCTRCQPVYATALMIGSQAKPPAKRSVMFSQPPPESARLPGDKHGKIQGSSQVQQPRTRATGGLLYDQQRARAQAHVGRNAHDRLKR